MAEMKAEGCKKT